jgi:L-serine dehydratase
MGAIKAITASSLLARFTGLCKGFFRRGNKNNVGPAKDMNTKYKETADGGLAINVPLSLPEC